MASKAMLCLLATLLLVSSQFSHGDVSPSISYPPKTTPTPPGAVKPPTPAVKPPTPAVKPPTPVVKPPPVYVAPPTPAVKPPTPVVKPPTPVVKPPTPVVKPPTPVIKPPPVYVAPPTPAVKPPTPVVKPPPVYTAPPTPAVPPTPVPRQQPRIKSYKECEPLCLGRCSAHSRKNVCQRACVTCCRRCKCVPPGTYGNREMCGTCYSQMKTSRDRLKCP